MSELAPIARLVASEYLALERQAETRHEFVDGEIFAMTGASLAHNMIVANMLHAIKNAIGDRPCDALVADMRVRISATRYFYPDLVVRCGAPRYEDEHRDSLLDPVLVAEVLSDSTEAYDRGEKFESYRSVMSLSDYLLVSQRKTAIEHFERMADGRWRLTLYGPGSRVVIASLGVEFAVDDVYRRVFDVTSPG